MDTDPLAKMLNHRINVCKHGCPLCNEIHHEGALSDLLHLYNTSQEKFVLQSNHFVAMRDISPLVPGHTILVTREHRLSMAQIPAEWYAELNAIKKDLTVHLSKQFGSLFYFEHGDAVGDITAGVCVKHAHLHFIPAKVAVEEWIRPYTTQSIKVRSIDYTEALNRTVGSYLYYENAHGNGLLVEPAKPLPEQFIRRVVAESCHLSEWDWKKIALPYLL